MEELEKEVWWWRGMLTSEHHRLLQSGTHNSCDHLYKIGPINIWKEMGYAANGFCRR